MYMDKKTFGDICRRYDLTICGNADVEDALKWVREILTAEADAMREQVPHSKHIAEYEAAALTIRELDSDEMCDTFDEIFRGENDLPYDYRH